MFSVSPDNIYLPYPELLKWECRYRERSEKIILLEANSIDTIGMIMLMPFVFLENGSLQLHQKKEIQMREVK